MAKTAHLFGRMLTEAVYRIVFLESKSVQIVQDEIGYALERESGGSALEYWRKGNTPARLTDIERLAAEIARRADFDREWLVRFVRSAGHARPEQFSEQLLAAPSTAPHERQPLVPATISQAAYVPAAGPAAFIGELSPFVIGPPIRHPRQFYGRNDELRRIFRNLRRLPLQNIAVIGPQRSGKTSLLHYLRSITSTPAAQLRADQPGNWLAQPELYDWVFIDFQDARMTNLEGLLRYILTELRMSLPEPLSLIEFMDVVSRELRRPTVILMDEIGAALEAAELDMRFWWSLRSLGTNQTGGQLAFILASHMPPEQQAESYGKPSPFFNIFQRLDLGPLSEAEANQLLDAAPLPITPPDAGWIIEQSRRWPALLQILCNAYYQARSDGETGDEWRDDGLAQIRSYRTLLG